MERIETLRKYGLFDARVPRYTSYPPANQFQVGLGQACQSNWLQMVPDGSEVSVYIHIPFCKRLCWFCACRTQGTKTLAPVDAYVATLKKEIALQRKLLNRNVKMGRLHLGGGTPTILSPPVMAALLEQVFEPFEIGANFEFSVEIDPTEASHELLKTLLDFGLNRASIGVQDFAPEVQQAIGRQQSYDETRQAIEFLRAHGVKSLNMDLLYGLPRQNMTSFQSTLEAAIGLQPDRVALYGYAHVPWMSKRQVMINEDELPDTMRRFLMAEAAQQVFHQSGYAAIGIDHFALPTDGLYSAAQNGQLRRNFQGYTDDQSEVLIGLGASAISKFPQGYSQNAPATSAYQARIKEGGLAGHKGYGMSSVDHLIGTIVEKLMCEFSYPEKELLEKFPDQQHLIRTTAISLMAQFTDLFHISARGLEMFDFARPLARVVASHVDQFAASAQAHSAAI